ncbi:MAG: hypothetical protein K2W95_21660 [Candidatus Obscuribacterales bacterium]|nr:hypothetical protein [Candidatus Obscuribacterales bacterium]
MISKTAAITLTVACLAGIAANSVRADDTTPAATAKSSAPLTGSVKSSPVVAAEGLRQMGEALKKIQRAAAELVGEATRQDYISVGDPDVVGSIIIPAIPDPSGMMPIGDYLPMRQGWVDYYLDQIAKLMPLYAAEVDNLALPAGIKSDATVLMDQMTPLYEDAKAHYLTLFNMQKALKGTDNIKFGEQAVMLHDDMKKIDELRKKVFAMVKSAEKSSK